jgi:hypothetical protein
MKRRTILAFVLMLTLGVKPAFSISPEAIFGIYGIQKQASVLDYQKYVGETVIYLPSESLNYIDKKAFKGKFNVEYTIISITGKDPDMVLTLQEKGSKKKVRMKIYNGKKVGKAIFDYEFSISSEHTVPLFFIEKFNSDKNKYIGKMYTNPLVKANYEIVDVIMKKKQRVSILDSFYPVMHFVLKNSLNGSLKTYCSENVEIECFKDDLSGKLKSTLIRVERPAIESERYGETQIIEKEGITRYLYEDEFIEILIFGDSKQFNFSLKNVSTNTLKIIWNEAAFVNHKGITCKIMHQGIKFSQRESDQPPTSIIRGASIEDVAVPTCNVRYSEILKEWVTDSMYPEGQLLKDYELRLMLPIQIKDVINEYIFIFRIDWIYNNPELLK